MSAGCGSIGREQSDPAPLQSNIMSCWSGLNCQHLFHEASRCIVFVQRERGAVVCIQGQPSLRLRVSSASQESTSNKTIDCQRLQCSTRGALCLASFVCLCLIQDTGDSVNLRLSLSIYCYEMCFASLIITSAANRDCFVSPTTQKILNFQELIPIQLIVSPPV